MQVEAWAGEAGELYADRSKSAAERRGGSGSADQKEGRRGAEYTEA